MTPRRAVLIVDDDPFIRKLIVMTLEGVSEFDLHEARDGIEACRLMRADPGMNGAKIVMLTATAEDSARVRASEAGADFFLTKPFSPLELLRLVSEL